MLTEWFNWNVHVCMDICAHIGEENYKRNWDQLISGSSISLISSLVFICHIRQLLSVFLCSLKNTESNEICILEFPKRETYHLEHKKTARASLVAQWLRVRLPMQGTWVQALVQEDPTCRGATGPVCHSCWACTLEPASHNSWAHVPGARARQREATTMRSPLTATRSSPCSPQLEKSPHTATKTQCSQKQNK